jgi:hypothetical protein
MRNEMAEFAADPNNQKRLVTIMDKWFPGWLEFSPERNTALVSVFTSILMTADAVDKDKFHGN